MRPNLGRKLPAQKAQFRSQCNDTHGPWHCHQSTAIDRVIDEPHGTQLVASQLLLVVENRHAEVWRLRPNLGRPPRHLPQWTPGPSLPRARNGLTLEAVNGKLFAIGGCVDRDDDDDGHMPVSLDRRRRSLLRPPPKSL